MEKPNSAEFAEQREKPNSAEFAEQRDHAILASYKAGNPALRMVPEMSKIGTKPPVPKLTPPQPAALPEQYYRSSSIDFAATSNSVLDALRRIDYNLKLTRAERIEARRLLCTNMDNAQFTAKCTLVILMSCILTFTLTMRCARK
tara:strand:- start:117 stop:551 length:435 start_codon:yes stop_codon:yes gene_type:complete